ncbi:MAG: hypothetical protein ACRD2L_17200, partial [Terriglobia bacterium]
SDSDFLRGLAENSKLFRVVVDAKAALMQMDLKQLRSICEGIGIGSARSIEGTADRIVEECGQRALEHVPEQFKARRSLIIKDQELATGEDIIRLGAYLREISKVVRQDLVQFVNERRKNSWLDLGGGG